MKARTRYSLIGAGIFSFIILAPLVVLFVSGTKYDFQNKRWVRTGTISVKTTPKKAQVSLNGKVVDTTPAAIRFVTPGDYDVLIHKDGYFDWQKRLNVKQLYVTYAHKDLASIYLLKSSPRRFTVREDVKNFYAGNDRLVYLTSDHLYVSDIDRPEKFGELALQKNYGNLEIRASENENFYLLYNQNFYLVFDYKGNKIIDISNLAVGPNPELQLMNDGSLYELLDSSLYLVIPEEGQKKPIATGIMGFDADLSHLYFITSDGIYNSDRYGNNKNFLSAISVSERSKIYRSNQNQIFILKGNTLYTLQDKLVSITDYVKSVSIDNDYRKLTYSTNNEVGVYDLSNNSTYLVTRSSEQIKNAQISYGTGWAFYTSAGRLQALELDNRDHQNNYTFQTVSDNAKLWAAKDAKTLYLLDNGKLEKLTIR